MVPGVITSFIKAATIFTSNVWSTFFHTVFWKDGRGGKKIFWLFQQLWLVALSYNIAPYSKCVVHQNRIILTHLQRDHLDVSYSWPSVLVAPHKSPTFTGSGKSVGNMMLTLCVLTVKSKISHTWPGFINKVKENVSLFPGEQSQVHRSLLGNKHSYLVFFTSLLSAYEPPKLPLLCPKSFAGHWISFMDTAKIYAHSSHDTKGFEFSTVQDQGQESIHWSECLCLMADADYPFQAWVTQTFYNIHAPRAPFSEALQVIMAHAFHWPACKLVNLTKQQLRAAVPSVLMIAGLMCLIQPVWRHGQAVLGRVATRGSDSPAPALTVIPGCGDRESGEMHEAICAHLAQH